MRGNNRLSVPKRTTIAVIADGECEMWYLKMLQRNERTLTVRFMPELPQKKSLNDIVGHVTESAEVYDKVFWVIDIDVVVREGKQAKKGGNNPVDKLSNAIKKLEKKYKNVTVILNNPCLEFWLLLHFETTSKYFDSCEEANRRLLKHLPSYEKTQHYYTKDGKDIYLMLRDKLKTAIANSRLLGPNALSNYNAAICTMHRLFDELGITT